MQDDAQTQVTDLESREDWFMSQLEQENLDTERCLKVLRDLFAGTNHELAVSLAELLQETLVEREQPELALDVLMIQATEGKRGDDFLKSCEKQIAGMFSNTPEIRAVTKNSGFSEGLPVSTVFRRLDVLRTLAPGVLCHDKTWGFGVITGIDYFYEKVEIDFDKKKEHEMKFGYASQTLDLISPDHILARKHNDPQGLMEQVDNDPADVVRIALRSYGPMSAPILMEKLVPDILPEEKWKRFWDTARKELKKDPLIHLPAKRSDPIRILGRVVTYDDQWFEDLSGQLNMEDILKLVENLLAVKKAGELTDSQRKILEDRLAFVLRGAEAKHHEFVARSVIAAHRLELDPAAIHLDRILERILKRELFLATLSDLNASQAKAFLAFLLEWNKETTINLWMDLLPELEVTVLSEIIPLLIENGRGDECAGYFRKRINKQRMGLDMLVWLWRVPEWIETWSLGSLPVLADLSLRALEKDDFDPNLRARNQMREKFGQRDWVQKVFGAMEADQRKKFFGRIKDSSAWPTMDHRSVLGRIIKVYPELEAVMAEAKSATAERARKTAGPLTSHRAFEERKRQLVHLVQVEIPKNSKEIGEARSYGDLRENFEYKAAKDMQTLLMRRQADFEKMLTEVKPTDFEGIPTDEVAMGTGCVLTYPDGRKEQFYILGVWDRDEKLGIISCETKMAQTLIGRKAGEDVTIPAEHGTEMCRLTEVVGLSDEVLAWIQPENTPSSS